MPTKTQKEGHYFPRSGQTSYDQNGQLHHSSKNNPCPVCERTKDKDCSWTQDGGLVLCHTYANESPPATINGYHFTGNYGNAGYHGPGSAAEYTQKKPRGYTGNGKPTQRFKPDKQKKRDIDAAIIEVEVKVDDLALMVAEGYETPALAQVHLAAWCKEHKHDSYQASQLLKEKLKGLVDQGLQSASYEVPRWLREYRLIEDKFGDRLRFNELTKQVELDGATFDANTAKIQLGIKHNTKLSGNREDLADSVVMIAKDNAYSPVTEYLKAVNQQYGDSTTILDGFAHRHFGTSTPIHQAMVKRFLIAAVARALKPGCKHDCALILQGPQSYGKSTFFKTLASEPWFDDSLGGASDKDERLKLHQFWIVEWAELETVFRRRDVSQVKAFMTSAIDNVRPPYGRNIEMLKRPSVLVGSTNQEQFLADTTGNRRFWVVPVTRPLNRSALRDERDRIWAAAFALYQLGEQWWLTDAESQEVNVDRDQYEDVHPWFEPIQHYVAGLNEISTSAILTNAIQIEISRQSNGDLKKVAGIMRKLGWAPTNNILSHQNERVRGWSIKNL
jgi:predicted P-loop ATPase